MKLAINAIMSALLICSLLLLVSCASTINSAANAVPLQTNQRLGILPINNHTDIPQAGARVAAITAGILHQKGIHKILLYKVKRSCDTLISCPTEEITTKTINTWARRNRLRYILSGTVNEWQYKTGLDGEPAANITLMIKDMKTGQVLWSGVGSKTGGSREGLSNVGQELITQLLDYLRLS